MTITKNTPIAIALLFVFIAFGSLGSEAFAKQQGRRHQGPPPEAYTACEGKSEGDTAEFESPRGDTVTGTCVQDGDRLVLRPDNPPNGKGLKDYAVVDTGQLGCYDDYGELLSCPSIGESFYGQDNQHDGDQPSYTDNGDGTVTDNVTGLMWQQSPDTDGDGDIDAALLAALAEAVALEMRQQLLGVLPARRAECQVAEQPALVPLDQDREGRGESQRGVIRLGDQPIGLVAHDRGGPLAFGRERAPDGLDGLVTCAGLGSNIPDCPPRR